MINFSDINLQNDSFWLIDYPNPGNLDCKCIPEEIDVAIVGGGYTGLSAARILAMAKKSVVVFEQQSIGFGASGRNFGSLSVGLPCSINKMRQRYGESLAKQLRNICIDSNEILRQIIFADGIECDYKNNGHIKLASKRSHVKKLEAEAKFLSDLLGGNVKFLTSTDLYNEIGSNRFYAGLLDTLSASLHPTKYLFGLAKTVIKSGGLIKENCQITKINKTSDDKFKIQHRIGITKAKEVIIATEGYTDGLIPKLRKRIFPIQSYQIVTEKLPVEIQDKISLSKRAFTTSLSHKNYFRLTSDGRLLFGGRGDLKQNIEKSSSLANLKARMLEFFPFLYQVDVKYSWSGNMGFTLDSMPHIGLISGVHYAAGYCGRGIAMSTYCGTEIGKIIAGKKQDTLLMKIKHPTIPLYNGNPWFLPFISRYLRVKDLLT